MYDDKEASMKFCPHCGAEQQPGSTFCASCGGQATGGPQKGVVQARVQYAGFWIRFVAALIDGIIGSIIIVPLSYILSTGLYQALANLFSLVYDVGFWVKNDGRTPGKMAIKVKVVKTDGSPITFGTAILRWIGYIISGLPLGLGFFWIAWDSQKQGWHDKIAGTYVITYES